VKRIHPALMFLSSCATAALATWITTRVHAQGSADNVIHVCSGADSVLHLTPVLSVCPAGQESLFLRKSGAPLPDAPIPDPEGRAADARIKSLEQRIAALEGAAARMGTTRRVFAPFEVDDSDGHRVFVVGEDHVVHLYNHAGTDVLHLTATDSGGFLYATSPAGALTATIGVSGSEANVKLLEGGALRAELGSTANASGVYRALFLSKSSKPLARIGGTALGTGELFVADTDGNVKAAMLMEKDGRGTVFAQNGQGIPVAKLTQGTSTDGGLLMITSADGTPMVDAGVHPAGFGLVRTGPGSFMMAAGVGLPGSFIMGKAK